MDTQKITLYLDYDGVLLIKTDDRLGLSEPGVQEQVRAMLMRLWDYGK